MSENYIVINGKKAELTDEQLKVLGIETKRTSPFERVKNGDHFFVIDDMGQVQTHAEVWQPHEQPHHSADNYFNDKSFAKQVALHQWLYRKLLKFAYDNGFEDTAKWDKHIQHWLIVYNTVSQRFEVTVDLTLKEAVVYFSTKEGTEKAIKEVVEPFMKEYPEFVW